MHPDYLPHPLASQHAAVNPWFQLHLAVDVPHIPNAGCEGSGSGATVATVVMGAAYILRECFQKWLIQA